MAQLVYETDYRSLATVPVNANTQFLTFHYQRTTTSDGIFTLYNSYLNNALVGNQGWNVANNSFVHLPSWTNRPGILRCPSANLNNDGVFWKPTNTNGNGGNVKFRIWAGFLADYAPCATNTNYWLQQSSKGMQISGVAYYGDGVGGPGSSVTTPPNDTPGWCLNRRTDSMRNPAKNGSVNEPCFLPNTPVLAGATNDYSANNHQGTGLNVSYCDGSGKWVPVKDTKTTAALAPNGPAYAGNNFLDTTGTLSGSECAYPQNTYFAYNYGGQEIANGDTNILSRYQSGITASGVADLLKMGFSPPNW